MFHVSRYGDRIVIVGNTGSNNTGEEVSNTEKGFAVGMDCSLLINPYYGKTNEEGMIKHIEAGLKFGPAIIYNVPGRTGQDIPLGVMKRLATHPNFAGTSHLISVCLVFAVLVLRVCLRLGVVWPNSTRSPVCDFFCLTPRCQGMHGT